VLDTIAEGATGLFFDAPEPAALAAAVRQADAVRWDPVRIHDHALQFGRPVFEARLVAFLHGALDRLARPLGV
jgi:hypothetical protein